MAVNWEDLRYILAVTREGTIFAGSESLAVSPSTMSRRLRSLEREHGTNLFKKFKHGAVLTEAGERVVAVAEAVERLTHELDAEIHGLDQKLAGSIRVSSFDQLLNLWMRDFKRFRERYPGVDLELTTSTKLVNLTRREADVAIRVADTAPEHLVGSRLAEVHYCIYGADELVAAVGSDAPYASFPWVSWDLAFSRGIDDWLQANALAVDIVARVSSPNVMQQALVEGLGIAILPCMVGDRDPRLKRIGAYFEGGMSLWLLTHPQLRGSARIMAFTRFMRDLVRRDKALIEGRLTGE